MASVSHFDERSGIVPFRTEWGQWWQTMDEVHIELINFKDIKAKDVKIQITSRDIKCTVQGNVILQGTLFRLVHPDEAVWTIEDHSIINIVLPKADYSEKEIIWEALFIDNRYKPDILTFNEMRKKLDLEKFQIENPGFDFSHAKLQKSYDDDATTDSALLANQSNSHLSEK